MNTTNKRLANKLKRKIVKNRSLNSIEIIRRKVLPPLARAKNDVAEEIHIR